MNHVRQGFTLIELIIVMLLLGILAALTIPGILVSTDAARVTSIESQLQVLRGQLEMYRAQTAGSFPTFASNGWDELIDEGLVDKVPINPQTESSRVVFGTSQDDAGEDDGWVWDAANARLYAAYFDEQTQQWTGP